MNEDRPTMIRQRLEAALAPDQLEVHDDSHKHRGHEGAKAGGGHYRVIVVSDRFQGLSRIQRHRLVYEAIGEAMRADVVHALSIQALTPDERHQ